MVRSWPSPAEDHLLVRDESRQPHRVDHRVAADQVGRRLRGAGRRVLLRLVVKLDDLRAREERRRLAREAHHQDRADREVRRDEEPEAALTRERAERHGVPAGRADDARDALLERGADVRRRRLGRREVDRRVESRHVDRVPDLEAVHLVPRPLQRGQQRRARPSPRAPKRASFTSRRRRRHEPRVRPLDGAPEPVLVRADAGRGQPVGREQHRRELRQLLLVDGVDLPR